MCIMFLLYHNLSCILSLCLISLMFVYFIQKNQLSYLAGSIENFINNSSANCSLQQIECYFIAQCLAYSSPPDECFWNPNSRVSGIVCDECLKVCRSKDKSLNFVQLLIGVILYSGGFIIQRLSMTIMASDCMGTEGQVYMLLLLLNFKCTMCIVY